MQALLPLSRVILGKVIVLLSGTRLCWEEHATPHGEVLASHSNAGHTDHHHSHPLEGIDGWNDCTAVHNQRHSQVLSVKQDCPATWCISSQDKNKGHCCMQ